MDVSAMSLSLFGTGNQEQGGGTLFSVIISDLIGVGGKIVF